MRKLLFLTAVSALAFLSACKKDPSGSNNSTTPKPADITGKTKQQIFMIQKWTILNWRDSSHLGDYEAIENCMKDDKYEFKSTSSYTLNRGTSKCDPSEPLTDNYTWSMASPNDTKVNVFGNQYDIISMSGEMIELRRYFPVTGGLATQILKLGWTY